MTKLGGRCITKISTEFEFAGHSLLDAHPKNLALGYNTGKISAGCLVCILLLSFFIRRHVMAEFVERPRPKVYHMLGPKLKFKIHSDI